MKLILSFTVPSSPMNMKARLLNSAVELEWSPPDCWNSKEIHYIVYYRNEEELEWVQLIYTYNFTKCLIGRTHCVAAYFQLKCHCNCFHY